MFSITCVQKLDLRAQMIRSLHSDLVHFTPKLEVALRPHDPSRPFTSASESLKMPLAAKACFAYSAGLSATPFCFCQYQIKSHPHVPVPTQSHDASWTPVPPFSQFVYLRDNRLSSLDGLELLKKVKVLPVNHNNEYPTVARHTGHRRQWEPYGYRTFLDDRTTQGLTQPMGWDGVGWDVRCWT